MIKSLFTFVSYKVKSMKIRYYYDCLYPVYFLAEDALHPEQEIEIAEDLLRRYTDLMTEFEKIQTEIEQEIKKQKKPLESHSPSQTAKAL